jgi:hypothetical protein
MVQFTIRPAAVLRVQAAVIACLVAASLAGQVSKYFLGHDVVFGLVNLFDLDGEGNVPTWYQASSLLVCAALLGIIAAGTRAARRPFALHWLGLSLIFVYLSADEASFIHELLNPVFRRWWHLPAFLYYSWVVAGASFVACLALFYAQFLRALPTSTRRRFVLSGVTYVGGALGVELVGAWIAVTLGTATFSYSVETTVEETLEMVGIALFTHALLTHLVHEFRGLSFEGEGPDGSARLRAPS